MLNIVKTGALALVMTGFALAGAAPAEAAYYHSQPGPSVQLNINGMYHHPRFRPHHRMHRVKVCTITWRHHHRVRVCEWVWRPIRRY